MKEYEFKGLNIWLYGHMINIKKSIFSFREDTLRFDGGVETPTGAVFKVYFGAETPIYYKRVCIEAELTRKYSL